MLEAVEAVHEAVAASPSEEPPLPPYPDIGDLSISGKKHKLLNFLTYIYSATDTCTVVLMASGD